MNKFNISRGMRTIKSVITANSPVLLVGATITGVVATGVLSARAGYKARGIVDKAQAERGSEPLTSKEKAQLTWLCYAAPALTATSAIASCMGVHFIHTRRFAELAGLYALTSGKLDDMKEEVEGMLTSKKQQELNDRMAQRTADANPLVNNEVIVTEDGKELCLDDWSGQWFHSNMNKIAEAVNETNAILISEGEVDLNTFYDKLGIRGTTMGIDLGWTMSKIDKIELIYGTALAPNGRPAISISFRHDPKPNLGRP